MERYKTPVAGYENQCVELLLEKLGVVTFDYDIEHDVLLLAKARDGMKEKRFEGFCRTLCTENRGMIHPDSIERLFSVGRRRACARSCSTWQKCRRGAIRGTRSP